MTEHEETPYTVGYIEQYIISLNDRQVLPPDTVNYKELNGFRDLVVSVLGSLKPRAVLQIKETNMWKWYLDDRKVNLANIKSPEELLVRALSIVEIIIREAMATGYWSSIFNEARDVRDHFFDFCEKEGKDVSIYKIVINNYECDYSRALLSARLRDEFQDVNIRQVDEKFEVYESKVEGLEKAMQKRSEAINTKIEASEKKLRNIEKRTGLAALHSSYHAFADSSRKKRRYVSMERAGLTLGAVVLALVAIFVAWESAGNYLLTLPIAALFVFVTYLIRVNIKRGDDLDQTILRIEHVLAVNEFYNNVKDDVVKPEDARLFNESYFKFVFSKIEPATSSQPDMYDGILNVIREVNRKK